MRKSQLKSTRGHLGGVGPDEGIIPPAALSFDKAYRPDNDPILRQVLTPEEMAQISQLRMNENSKRTRAHSHFEQTEKDVKRAMFIETSKRRQEQEVISAAGRRKKNGEVYYLGKAYPVNEDQTSELLSNKQGELDKVVDTDQVEEVITTKSETPSFDEFIATSEQKEMVQPKEESVPVPEALEKDKVFLGNFNEDDAVGGTPFFAGSLGTNLRPMEPQGSGKKKPGRKRSA